MRGNEARGAPPSDPSRLLDGRLAGVSIIYQPMQTALRLFRRRLSGPPKRRFAITNDHLDVRPLDLGRLTHRSCSRTTTVSLAISPSSFFSLISMEDFFSELRTRDPLTSSATFCDSRIAGAREMVDSAISIVPNDWVAETVRARGLDFAFPMYGFFFLVDDWLARRIREHLTEIEFGEDFDRQLLMDCGWRVIPTTGLFAYELDGRLLLGVDGIGYDFVEAHWLPLYQLLGLGWHTDD